MTGQVTVITTRRPAKLSKTVRRGPDGGVLREGGGLLVDGNAEIAKVESLVELAALLQRLGPSQALTFGVPRGGDGRIMSRGALAREGCAQGILTRTRDRFAWPDGPGILMLDHDPYEVALSRDELVQVIRTAAPGLADVDMLWWPSASSHICDADTGEDLAGLRGQRMYLMVREASDIPRAGAALVDRLWAAGYGRIIVSVAGVALERCPIDASVWQPERLDFAAGACCGEGLVQRRGAPHLVPGRTEIVDTKAALPDDPAISKTAAEARRLAKTDAKEAIAAAREEFLDAHGSALLAPQDREDPEKREVARTVIRRAVDHGVLTADFTVEVETAPGYFETITVGGILDDRAGFHGRFTRDPLEPGYDRGRATGKLFLLDSRPTLFSFAHHGRSFRLVRSPERVEVVQGRLAGATESALGILRKDPAVFDFGGQVVLVENGRMLPLDEHSLGYYIAGGVQFWQNRKAGGELIAVNLDPPARLVRQILSLGSRRQLKPLTAIVTAPTIRTDGSMLTSPGYDLRTSLLVAVEEEAFEVPLAPARDEITRALSNLLHPFESFPLVDALARGGLLAALLTAVARPALPTAPAFAMDAPVQGSGKTLLASCVSALATGYPPEVWPHTASRDDEETRKRLFAALRDGTTALIWDNVTGIFDSAALAAAITAPVLRDRVLGRSESLSIPNRALLLLTGNNLCPAGDLSRRIITIRIDPGTDAPFARQFDLDPLDYVLHHRIDLACSALVLIRGWLTSGAARAEGRMASFEVWDDLVRQTVCWIGTEIAPGAFDDPLDLVRRAQGADPEQESLFALLQALDTIFASSSFTARDVCQRSSQARADPNATSDEKALAETLADLGGDRSLASTKSVGRVLKFREGRIVSGLRLLSRPGRSGREYRIEATGGSDRCGFGGFGGFNSSHFETVPDTAGAKSKWAESNPPNPPNPQIISLSSKGGLVMSCVGAGPEPVIDLLSDPDAAAMKPPRVRWNTTEVRIERFVKLAQRLAAPRLRLRGAGARCRRPHAPPRRQIDGAAAGGRPGRALVPQQRGDRLPGGQSVKEKSSIPEWLIRLIALALRASVSVSEGVETHAS